MLKKLKGNLTKKILMALVIVILCNFTFPMYSHADFGGVLLSPIRMFISAVGDIIISAVNSFFTGVWIGASDAKAVPGSADDYNNDAAWDENIKGWALGSNQIDWPTILISPQEIFSGKVMALNVNFLRNIDTSERTVLEQETPADKNASNENFRQALLSGNAATIGTKSYQQSLANLRVQISKWYVLIRNLSAAALFCVLIYVGIRMVLSSVSEEKAKYKKMMVNWVVAICLVFFLHYMMSIIMFTTEKLVETIGDGLNDNTYTIHIPGSDTTAAFHMKYGAKIGGGHTDDIERRMENSSEST